MASPRGLRAVLGPRLTLAEVEAEARSAFGPLPQNSLSLEGLARRLGRYLSGRPEDLDWPLDTDKATPFQRAVWDALRIIPRGEVRTYGQIAAALGRPRAARAVGQAVGANPFAILVPCHRVVGHDGALTGYGGGLVLKERLLVLEGHPDAPTQRARTERRKGYRPARRERRSPLQ